MCFYASPYRKVAFIGTIFVCGIFNPQKFPVFIRGHHVKISRIGDGITVALWSYMTYS